MLKPRLSRYSRLAFHRIPLALAATLLIASVVINLANVIGRYVFHVAVYWAEEAMIYLAIWSIFLAAIAIAYDRADLTMGLLSARLAAPFRQIADGVMTAITVAVCLFMAVQSVTITRTLIRNGQNSLALELPMWMPQSSLLFGFVMIAAAVIARYVLSLAEKENVVRPEAASPS
jgi:TRAP-type C4-dicarboxylate transport system permease small subunit